MEKDPVILVTGGSRGIGRAITEALARRGRRVAFTWQSEEDTARDVKEDAKGWAQTYQLDLADRSAPRILIERIEDEMGPIEGLVNNAAIERSRPLALMSDEEWDEVIDVNLGGAFRMCREAIRPMISRRAGSIVNIASLSAVHGVAGHTAYGASKGGLLAMTRNLARELGRFRIRVNAVIPGFVPTDMTASLSPRIKEVLRAGECLTDGVSPALVAQVVVFLLSSEANGITGQFLPVDAGATA